MPYGDVVTVASNGVRVAAKLLRPIGIADKGLCWGVWLPKPRVATEPPHLLVSAIHPDSWPVTVRLEVQLADRAGAMGRAAQCLADFGFNILAADCTPSGHSHATWNVLAESLYLKPLAATLDRRSRQSAEETIKRDSRFLGFLMLAIYRFVRDELFKTDARLRATNPADGFLSDRLREPKGSFLHKLSPREGRAALSLLSRAHVLRTLPPLDKSTTQADQSTLKRYVEFSKACADEICSDSRSTNDWAIGGRYLADLAYNWFYGENSAMPMKLKYDAERGALYPQSPGEFQTKLRDFRFSAPQDIIASFDTTAKYMRLVFPHAGNRPRLFLTIAYESTLPRNDSLRGVLTRAARALEPHVNLARVTNSVREVEVFRDGRQHEQGEMRFTCAAREPREDIGVFQNHVQRCVDDLRDALRPRVAIRPKILPFGRRLLFISTRVVEDEKGEFWSWMKKALPSVIREAKACGFSVRTVGGPQHRDRRAVPIIDEVADAMRGCDACLQFYHTPPEKRPWLLAEYVLARSLKLVPILMVEQDADGKPSLEEWRNKLSTGDARLNAFTRVDGGNLRRMVGKALNWEMGRLLQRDDDALIDGS